MAKPAPPLFHLLVLNGEPLAPPPKLPKAKLGRKPKPPPLPAPKKHHKPAQPVFVDDKVGVSERRKELGLTAQRKTWLGRVLSRPTDNGR
jgi:hypothetical protein